METLVIISRSFLHGIHQYMLRLLLYIWQASSFSSPSVVPQDWAKLLSPHPGNLIWMDILAQLSGPVSIREHPHQLIATIVQMSTLPVHLTELANPAEHMPRRQWVLSDPYCRGTKKYVFDEASSKLNLANASCESVYVVHVCLCFKACRSCDSLTVTSHNSLGCRVARFVIIVIGAWGLIGKWGQSNEAAGSVDISSLSTTKPPPPPTAFAWRAHSILSLSLWFLSRISAFS